MSLRAPLRAPLLALLLSSRLFAACADIESDSPPADSTSPRDSTPTSGAAGSDPLDTPSGSGGSDSAPSDTASASGGSDSTALDSITFPAPECLTPADCPDPGPCHAATCESGNCVNTPSPDGASDTQVPGDCRQLRCQSGAVLFVPDDSDLPPPSDCLSPSCSGGLPLSTPAPTGTPCGPSSTFECSPSAACLPISCTNGAQNAASLGETDVDCGGTCPQCPLGKTCLTDSDCQSATCTNNICS